ncbi:MAG: amidohydrolase [Clostridiales bacterium]|nr:amidohydrolase [Clostridiales bacterium]
MKEIVIDFHVHLSEYDTISKDTYEFFSAFHPSKEEFDANSKKYSSPENFVQLMDYNKVDYSVILAEIAPLTSGIASNERVEAFCRGNPRLIPFCTLNPYIHPNMAKMLEDLCQNHGFKGIKLYPSYNHFYPNDNMMYPLYSLAERLGIPVLFHTGTSIFSNSRLKYSDPIYIDDIAVDFPNLKIVMAHGGRGPWYDLALTLVRLHENVFIEISGLPPKKLLEYFPSMERFSNKFIFGSDWPAVDVNKNVEMIRKLNISEDAVSNILGENARKVLGLE